MKEKTIVQATAKVYEKSKEEIDEMVRQLNDDVLKRAFMKRGLTEEEAIQKVKETNDKRTAIL